MLYIKEDLEQAYIEGYNNACDELESMLEDSNNEYSLEDECNYYTWKPMSLLLKIMQDLFLIGTFVK